ncbi:hypothetical protein [Puia sp.]|jgi:hypothetical protein|uniref:hypothetical protein n=1 Tax=Puia sp. TaxID=2045100 RepID=UPI002F429112
MKKILLPALFFSAVMQLSAQTKQPPVPDDAPKWSIGLVSGVAIPIGPFARVETPTGHFDTHPGPAAELSLAYRVAPSFSFVLAAAEQYNQGGGISYFTESVGFSLPSRVYNDHNWKMTRLLGGGEWTVPLRKTGRLSLLFRGLLGAQKTKAADTYERLRYPLANPSPLGGYYVVSYPGPSFPWTFAYEADAGIQWKMGKHLALTVNTGLGGAAPAKTITYLFGDMLIPERSAFPTTTVHINAGLTYFFPYSKKISVAP